MGGGGGHHWVRGGGGGRLFLRQADIPLKRTANTLNDTKIRNKY